MANNDVKQLNKRTVLYNANQTPPISVLIVSALQHMIIILSIGMAVPITIAKVAGLNLQMSGTFLASALFAVGISTILTSSKHRLFGSGFMGFAAVNSAALSACVIAIETGGLPLMFGMTIFSGVLNFVLGSFTYKLRRFFPAELTGTMIFILGLNVVPIALGNFLGSKDGMEFNPRHILIALITFLIMLTCTLFIKQLKPYAVLIGIVSGCALSIALGEIDLSALDQISNQSIVALPIYPERSYSFDTNVILPFIVISVSTLIDNIGDLSAGQSANNPDLKRADWKSIEGGVRAFSLGNVLSGLIGGPVLTSSSANIGIASATGNTSRKVAYLAGIMLAVLAFFPGLTGIFALVPVSVLGAILMYSACYIMAGGFSVLSECVMDDRRIFSVFLSICFAVSTLIPDLYSFLPDNLEKILVSPMVMGVIVLLITTIATRIGTKKVFSFESAVSPSNIMVLNEEIEKVCCQKGTERSLMRKIQISVDSLCESIYEVAPGATVKITIRYDPQQLHICAESRGGVIEQADLNTESATEGSFYICMMILENIYDTVKTRISDGNLIVDLSLDL